MAIREEVEAWLATKRGDEEGEGEGEGGEDEEGEDDDEVVRACFDKACAFVQAHDSRKANAGGEALSRKVFGIVIGRACAEKEDFSPVPPEEQARMKTICDQVVKDDGGDEGDTARLVSEMKGYIEVCRGVGEEKGSG